MSQASDLLQRKVTNPYAELANNFRESLNSQPQEQEQPVYTQQDQVQTQDYSQAPQQAPNTVPEDQYNNLMNVYNNLYAQHEELLRKQSAIDNAVRQAELMRGISEDGFKDLETISATDATKISQAVLNSLDPMRKELEAQRKALSDYAQYQQNQTQLANNNAVIQKVLSVHPDYYQFSQTPQYKNFMSSKIGKSSKTYDQMSMEEFSRGNADFIIDVLNQAKGNKNSSMVVAPAQVQGSMTGSFNQNNNTLTLQELNSLYQMHAISPEQYKEQAAKIRATRGRN